MEATRERQATLVDLLDRVLDKGLVLHADVIISVSGIPLIGLKLSALLANVDTMVRYGLWAEWDTAIRAVATEEERRRRNEELQLLQGEKPVFQSPCSCREHHRSGGSWKHGTLYLTTSGVTFIERASCTVLFESGLAHIAGFSFPAESMDRSAPVRFELTLKDGRVISLSSRDAMVIAEEIGRELPQRNRVFRAEGHSPEGPGALPDGEEEVGREVPGPEAPLILPGRRSP